MMTCCFDVNGTQALTQHAHPAGGLPGWDFCLLHLLAELLLVSRITVRVLHVLRQPPQVT